MRLAVSVSVYATLNLFASPSLNVRVSLYEYRCLRQKLTLNLILAVDIHLSRNMVCRSLKENQQGILGVCSTQSGAKIHFTQGHTLFQKKKPFINSAPRYSQFGRLCGARSRYVNTKQYVRLQFCCILNLVTKKQTIFTRPPCPPLCFAL